MYFLPKDKMDIDAVAHLESLSNEEIKPYLDILLSWLQDLNWPVAISIAERLSRCGEEIVEPIKKVLATNDSIWKYWVLSEVVINASPKVREALFDDIARLIDHASDDEKIEEVDLAAKEVMELYNSDKELHVQKLRTNTNS